MGTLHCGSAGASRVPDPIAGEGHVPSSSPTGPACLSRYFRCTGWRLGKVGYLLVGVCTLGGKWVSNGPFHAPFAVGDDESSSTYVTNTFSAEGGAFRNCVLMTFLITRSASKQENPNFRPSRRHIVNRRTSKCFARVTRTLAWTTNSRLQRPRVRQKDRRAKHVEKFKGVREIFLVRRVGRPLYENNLLRPTIRPTGFFRAFLRDRRDRQQVLTSHRFFIFRRFKVIFQTCLRRRTKVHPTKAAVKEERSVSCRLTKAAYHQSSRAA